MIAKRKKSKSSVDFSKLSEGVASQFRGLDTSNPASWPILPKVAMGLVVIIAVFALFWYLLVTSQIEALEGKQQEEKTLKDEYVKKYAKVVNLEPLLKQRQQVEQYVAQLEKQLPSKAEMDALLSDINQAGVGRNLQFEVFRPSTEEVKDYYAVLPVAIKVSGEFPDIAGFAADIAHLSRIVTLNDIAIDPRGGVGASKAADTLLQMQATANTYRYLDKSEVTANAAQKGKKGGAK